MFLADIRRAGLTGNAPVADLELVVKRKGAIAVTVVRKTRRQRGRHHPCFNITPVLFLSCSIFTIPRPVVTFSSHDNASFPTAPPELRPPAGD